MHTSNYEIYTKNPQTGEEGWDIKMVNVIGETKEERLATLQAVPNFDVVILFNYKVDSSEEDIERYNKGEKYYFD